MTGKRLKAIAKLLVLFGAPLAFVVGLFSWGVHCGVQHRHAILSFEHEWLGLDVDVPPAPPSKTTATEAPPSEAPRPQDATDAGRDGTAKVDEPPSHAPPASNPPPAPAHDPPSADPPSADSPSDEPGEPVPALATPDPLEGDLAARLALPVTVGIEVLVDQELIDAHPDWIDYVQRTVSEASQIYQTQFGITLDLVGVGRWPVATAGMGADALLDDLRARPRQSGQVLVGFTGRPLDGSTSGRSETPTADSPFNGARAVVYAIPGNQRQHLRTLLHELGHLFGALDVVDPDDPAYAAGSWMSYSRMRDRVAPWIDAENRRRILERKDRPFRPDTEED